MIRPKRKGQLNFNFYTKFALTFSPPRRQSTVSSSNPLPSQIMAFNETAEIESQQDKCHDLKVEAPSL